LRSRAMAYKVPSSSRLRFLSDGIINGYLPFRVRGGKRETRPE